MEKLKIPLAYQGGKDRLSGQIIDIILSEVEVKENSFFYDLCCGTGAVTIALYNKLEKLPNIRMVDSSVWGDFWKAIGNGDFLTEMFDIYLSNVPEDKTKIIGHVKNMVLESPYDGVFNSELYRYLIIQANAFGGTPVWIENGKWKKAGGYKDYWLPTKTSNRRSPVNPLAPMTNTLSERMKNLSHYLYGLVDGYKEDVSKFVKFEDGAIVYIDPPYKNTSGYGYNLNIESWIEEVISTNKDITIFVSEGYEIPDSNMTWLLSTNRTKGNINNVSGKTHKGHPEWLSMIKN